MHHVLLKTSPKNTLRHQHTVSEGLLVGDLVLTSLLAFKSIAICTFSAICSDCVSSGDSMCCNTRCKRLCRFVLVVVVFVWFESGVN